MSKRCGRCRMVSNAPTEHFSKDKTKSDGLALYCRMCDFERRRGIAPPDKPRHPWSEDLKLRANKEPSAGHWRLTGFKICSRCKVEKPSDPANFHTDSKKGIASACRLCESERASRKYPRKTPDRFVSDTHRECTRCGTVKPNLDFPKCSRLNGGISIYCRVCQAVANKESRGKYREERNRREAERINSDPKRRMNYRILGLVRKAIARKDVPVRPLSVTKGFWATVGYDKLELCRHLESQFLPGMGWHNMREWHIDHIKPVRLFHFESFDCPEFAECWGLPNLRPLWARDNLVKGGRYTPPEEA